MDPGTLESLMLRELRRGPAVSRRDLAERLGVARSTAGRRVDSLIERGLLREKGLETRLEAGRPRRLLELRGGFGKFAGFDFDARRLHAVLVDFEHVALEERSLELPSSPRREDVLERLRGILASFREASGGPLLACGIGVPGRVSRAERLALGYPYIAGWEQVDLPAELGLPRDFLQIENNTRAIALGEYWLGEGGPVESLACLNVRTGISVALIAGGRLLRGQHGLAGEIRAWRVPEEWGPRGGAAAGVPARAWIEDRATVRALAGDGAAAWSDFVEACRRGEEGALAGLRCAVLCHADAVARIAQLADPGLVVLSGDFEELGEPYLAALREETAAALAGHYVSPPPMRFVSRGRFTGAHGAAALAAEHYRPGA